MGWHFIIISFAIIVGDASLLIGDSLDASNNVYWYSMDPSDGRLVFSLIPMEGGHTASNYAGGCAASGFVHSVFVMSGSSSVNVITLVIRSNSSRVWSFPLTTGVLQTPIFCDATSLYLFVFDPSRSPTNVSVVAIRFTTGHTNMVQTLMTWTTPRDTHVGDFVIDVHGATRTAYMLVFAGPPLGSSNVGNLMVVTSAHTALLPFTNATLMSPAIVNESTLSLLSVNVKTWERTVQMWDIKTNKRTLFGTCYSLSFRQCITLWSSYYFITHAGKPNKSSSLSVANVNSIWADSYIVVIVAEQNRFHFCRVTNSSGFSEIPNASFPNTQSPFTYLQLQ
jgi:hypothetical protein